jgi:hypothetical protein
MIPLSGTEGDAFSILSYLQAAHSNRLGLFPFFSMKEARAIRLINREALQEVKKFPWNDFETRVYNVTRWRASFPKAIALNLKCHQLQIGLLVGIEQLSVPIHFADTDLSLLTTLKRLDIRNSLVSDYSIQKLVNLENLRASFTQISDEVFQNFPRLTTLNISFCRRITNRVLKYLKNIADLNISFNEQMNDEGFDDLQKLEHLKIWRTNLTNRALLKVPSTLKTLDMSYTSLDDSSIAKFKNLTRLDISGCLNLTYQGVRAIINSNLKLRAHDCEEGLQLLEKILGKNS